jgi:site-specific DNA-methyltransferase (adenine-specific)
MYELFHANCIDVLRDMADKSIDCIVTDMPYGIGVDFGDYCDNLENLKTLIDLALPEMRRVGRRVVITPGVRNLFCYPEPTWTLGWFFGGGARGRWGFNHWQPIIVYGADPLHRLKMMHTDVIRATSTALADRTEHPCPKPLSFVRKLINRVAPSPADIILDPFMGSGTTGVAAIQLGHKFIGIEINGDYLAIAKRRIAQASPDFQLVLDLKAKEIVNEHA